MEGNWKKKLSNNDSTTKFIQFVIRMGDSEWILLLEK